MPEIFFIIADLIETIPGLETLATALYEMLIAMSGGDWGCGATSDLFFGGNDVAACEWINGLPDATEPSGPFKPEIELPRRENSFNFTN